MRNITTIIIPNYNGMAFLDTCLRSLETQTDQRFELLIVDNGSADGSVAWLRDRQARGQEEPAGSLYHPDRFRVIYLQENTGFAAAVNTGIRASSTPYVLLLNNDVRADAHFVEALVRRIRRSRRIFSVASKMIRMYEPELMDSAGDQYTVVGWTFNRGTGRPVGYYDRPCRVFSACAGAAIYRRSVFDQIGGFDERHFAYLEDVDVAYRARLWGYYNYYEPAAVVWHVGSGTSGSRYNEFKVRLTIRNNIWLNYKNMPALQLAVNALPIALGISVKYVFFARKGLGKAFREGLAEGLSTCGECERVTFHWRAVPRYIGIQAELILHFGEYLAQVLMRKKD